MSGIETTYDDFPNGLACFNCKRQIEWGEPHYEWLDGMIDAPNVTNEGPCFSVVLACDRCEAQKAGRIVPFLDGDLNPLGGDVGD